MIKKFELKQKIKLLAIMLTVLVLLMMQLVMPLSAQSPKLTISPSSQNVKRSQTVKINVRVENLELFKKGLVGYSGAIHYDPAVVSFVKASNALSGWGFYTTLEPGTVKFVGYDDTAGSLLQFKDTDIFEVEMEVLASAPLGESPIRISKAFIGDPNVEQEAEITNGSITIVEDAVQPQPQSSNNTLSSLSLSGGINLNPSFKPETASYSANVSKNTDSIDISAVLADSKGKILSGQGTHQLKDGDNSLSVVVEAEDGSRRTYTIVVTKPKQDSQNPGENNGGNNNNGGGNTNPGGNNNNGGGSTNPGGNTNTGGSNGGQVNPNPNTNGSNTINIHNSSNNNITGLNGLNLLPAYSKDVSHYNASVGRETSSLVLKIVTEDPNASVIVKGGDKLEFGVNKVSVVVIAPNGEQREITIDVNRSEEESKATLSALSVGGYAINPGFNEGVYFYSMNVEDDVNALAVSASPKFGNTSVNIAGNQRLTPGLNYVKISVVGDGGMMNTYVVEVNKSHKASDELRIHPAYLWAAASSLIVVFMLVVLALTRRNQPQTVIYTQAFDPRYMVDQEMAKKHSQQ